MTKVVTGFLAALFAAVAVPAAAQGFPDGKPIEMTTLFGAASASTQTARILADGMAKVLGVPVPIIDKPGGAPIRSQPRSTTASCP